MTGLDRWLPAKENTYRMELPKLPEPPAHNMNMPMGVTAKTAKTPGVEVVSVLAVGGIGISVYGERAKPDTTGPATEADFRRKYEEILASLNAEWPPEPVKIKALPTAPKIFQHAAEADRLWVEARQSGRYAELFHQLRAALAAWESALLNGVRTLKYARRRSSI